MQDTWKRRTQIITSTKSSVPKTRNGAHEDGRRGSLKWTGCDCGRPGDICNVDCVLAELSLKGVNGAASDSAVHARAGTLLWIDDPGLPVSVRTVALQAPRTKLTRDCSIPHRPLEWSLPSVELAERQHQPPERVAGVIGIEHGVRTMSVLQLQ